MNWNENDPYAGAMGCLQCGRLLTVGVACACVDEPMFGSAADETAYWREKNLWSVRDSDESGHERQ